jgi:hypothetical protein
MLRFTGQMLQPEGLTVQPQPELQRKRVIQNNSFDNCGECGMAEPPTSVNRLKLINWIQCGSCSYWYHSCCLDEETKSAIFCDADAYSKVANVCLVYNFFIIKSRYEFCTISCIIRLSSSLSIRVVR